MRGTMKAESGRSSAWPAVGKLFHETDHVITEKSDGTAAEFRQSVQLGGLKFFNEGLDRLQRIGLRRFRGLFAPTNLGHIHLVLPGFKSDERIGGDKATIGFRSPRHLRIPA